MNSGTVTKVTEWLGALAALVTYAVGQLSNAPHPWTVATVFGALVFAVSHALNHTQGGAP